MRFERKVRVFLEEANIVQEDKACIFSRKHLDIPFSIRFQLQQRALSSKKIISRFCRCNWRGG